MQNPRKIGLWSLTVLLIVGIIGGGFAWQQHQQKRRQPRIVATTYAVVQIADKLNLTLVGVPTTANTLPQRYQHVAKVGNPMNPSVEKITALKPTAVYSVTTLRDQFGKAFKAQHVTPHFLDLTSVAHLEQTLTQLGNRYHRQSAAAKQVRHIQTAKKVARDRAQHQTAPRVLVIMGLPGANYMVATNRAYVGDLVRLAGGTNVFTSKTQEYMQPNDEAIQKANPQVILRLEHAMPKMVTSQFNQEFKDNAMWATTDAVKHHRVYDLQEPIFDATANMRVTTALDQVSHWLYPKKGAAA
ncbi:heme ABC transporter substrate-binding protein IsdE [Levilactobacillus hammesii]|uniref:High-affinity heme uptake system protein IsdE n=1 Tax=Levilactobacillus hammesii DSM 16381 TaxID=1423753 RepID=A0A0R1V092_9LACO|nr:heme ABC transporter substrate-binding protein IsdE [Levilactobacillus hammesii]KRL95467.1 ABC-type Fe3+-hydroxamate transport system, periplasmic component [Levilactobacillus hammesii DSM 16381]